MSDIKQLYAETILEHNRKPRNYGSLATANQHAEGFNPLCGDHIWVDVLIMEQKIADIAFHGESCAICKAAASLMTVAVKAKMQVAALALIADFRAMINGEEDLIAANPALRQLRVFAGVRDIPTRVKCAILPWHTLAAALKSMPEED